MRADLADDGFANLLRFPETMMGELPWYHAGLQFTCSQCGDCCSGAPGYVWVNQAEIDAIAERLETTADEVERLYAVSYTHLTLPTNREV